MMSPAFTLIVGGLIGACLGSFSATAVGRLARGERRMAGRSRCDACAIALGYSRTLPIISYVQALGACRSCGARIDPAQLIGEVAGAGIVPLALAVAPMPRALVLAALGLFLLAAALFDYKTHRLPDLLTLAVAGLASTLAIQRSPVGLLSGLAAAFITFSLLELSRRGFLRIKGENGLGRGDIKLIAALAIWLGPATPWAVAVAAVLGLAAHHASPSRNGMIAFGPMIALACWGVGMASEASPWL